MANTPVLVFAAALLVSGSGCSMVGMREPELPLRSKPACTDSRGLALVDFAGAALAGVKWAQAPSDLWSYRSEQSNDEYFFWGAATGALIASGIYGLTRASLCREAKAAWRTGPPGA